jgi:4-hydroxybenzoate polyprenyltransferase
MSQPPRSALHTWLQLLRAPNLFTVPGDPLAGFLLASDRLDERLAFVILASLCFYSHGLLLNDLADLNEDRRERPNRPLPSGAASPGAVRIVCVALALLALGLCFAVSWPAFYTGLALLAAVVLYNLWSKKIAALGPLNMGLCRGLSLLLGATTALETVGALPPLALVSATGLTLYIALVTNLARIETAADPPKGPRNLPFAGLVAVVVPVFLLAIDRTHPLALWNLCLYAVSAYTLYAGFKIHRKLTREPAPPIPPMIGQLIRLLLPLQAIFCLASRSLAGSVCAVLLLALWPVSRAVSRRFYAS